jgi:zinc-ribbon domain
MPKVSIPAVRLHAPKIRTPRIQPPKLSRAPRNRPARSAKRNGRPEPNPELIAERGRLLEKFTVMQADLGGAFYEMAIRDHVKMDVLTRKAAELQRLDIELSEVEEALELERSQSTGTCAQCGTEYQPGARFCSSCGAELEDA